MPRSFLAALLLGPAAVAAAPVPKEDDAARMRRLYGEVVDPGKDCRCELDRDKLRITVPEGVRWLDAPTKPTGRGQNAPRVLKDVAGDFVATVRVTIPVPPAAMGKDAATESGHGSAGLVVWAGTNTFVTWTRELDTKGGKSWRGWRTLYVIPTGMREDDGAVKAEQESVYLRVTRNGQAGSIWESADGKEWKEITRFGVEWEKTVRVGLVAMNAGTHSFSATFDEYTVTQPMK